MLQLGSLIHGLGGTVDFTHNEMEVALVSSHIVRRVHSGMPLHLVKIQVLALVGQLANWMPLSRWPVLQLHTMGLVELLCNLFGLFTFTCHPLLVQVDFDLSQIACVHL